MAASNLADTAITILNNLTNAYDTESASIMAGGRPWAYET